MGMLLVLAAIVAMIGVVWLFGHAIRADPSEEKHHWIAVVPLMILGGWLVVELVIH